MTKNYNDHATKAVGFAYCPFGLFGNASLRMIAQFFWLAVLFVMGFPVQAAMYSLEYEGRPFTVVNAPALGERLWTLVEFDEGIVSESFSGVVGELNASPLDFGIKRLRMFTNTTAIDSATDSAVFFGAIGLNEGSVVWWNLSAQKDNISIASSVSPPGETIDGISNGVAGNAVFSPGTWSNLRPVPLNPSWVLLSSALLLSLAPRIRPFRQMR